MRGVDKIIEWDDVKFPELPDGNFGERTWMEIAAAAYAAVTILYDRLRERCDAEKRLLAHILGGDWHHLVSALRESIAERLGAEHDRVAKAAPVSPCPSDPHLDKMVLLCKGLSVEGFLGALDDGIRRCMVSSKLVPLGDADQATKDLFKSCVEAEDLHLTHIAWLKTLIGHLPAARAGDAQPPPSP